MSARAPVPAAHSRGELSAAAAERESLSAAASRQAEQLPPPEREGKEAAREERAASATSAGARGEPSPVPVLGHSVPQAAVPVRPLALHLAHKTRGPGGPFGGEPPPPLSRDPTVKDAREKEAAAGPEEKLRPPPPPPKENPWTKKPPQHLSPAGTGPPPPPLETLEAGRWLPCGGHWEGVCLGDSRGGRGWRGAGGGASLLSLSVRGISFQGVIHSAYLHKWTFGKGAAGRGGTSALLDLRGCVAWLPAGAASIGLPPRVSDLGKLTLGGSCRSSYRKVFVGLLERVKQVGTRGLICKWKRDCDFFFYCEIIDKLKISVFSKHCQVVVLKMRVYTVVAAKML